MPHPGDDLTVIALAAGYFGCEPSWSLPWRTKSGHQLWLAAGGRAELLDAHEGRFTLRERAALLIPPGEKHSGAHDSTDPLQCYVIHFQVRRFGIPMPAPLLAEVASAVLEGEDWTRALDSADEACRETADRRRGSALIANAAVARLLGLFLRYRPPAPPRTSSAPVTQILERMASDYHRDWTLPELAGIARLSPAYLCRVFRREIGLTPFQYLRQVRLNHARELLASTDLAIGDIAVGTGFPDRFYFSRAFRRVHGLTPTAYRRACQEPPLV